MSDIATVSVQILGKDYQISCPKEEVEALTESARYLDDHMNTIKDSGKVVGLDRIAVMAALNIANELLSQQDHTIDLQEDHKDKLAELSHRLDVVLAEHKQLSI